MILGQTVLPDFGGPFRHFGQNGTFEDPKPFIPEMSNGCRFVFELV